MKNNQAMTALAAIIIYVILMSWMSRAQADPVYTLMEAESASDINLMYAEPVIKGISYADCMLAKNNYNTYVYCVEIVIIPLDRTKLMEAYDANK